MSYMSSSVVTGCVSSTVIGLVSVSRIPHADLTDQKDFRAALRGSQIEGYLQASDEEMSM